MLEEDNLLKSYSSLPDNLLTLSNDSSSTKGTTSDCSGRGPCSGDSCSADSCTSYSGCPKYTACPKKTCSSYCVDIPVFIPGYVTQSNYSWDNSNQNWIYEFVGIKNDSSVLQLYIRLTYAPQTTIVDWTNISGSYNVNLNQGTSYTWNYRYSDVNGNTQLGQSSVINTGTFTPGYIDITSQSWNDTTEKWEYSFSFRPNDSSKLRLFVRTETSAVVDIVDIVYPTQWSSSIYTVSLDPDTAYIWNYSYADPNGTMQLASSNGWRIVTDPAQSSKVWIYNGSSWVKAIPWVYSGSSWKKATAWVYNNNGWKKC